MRTTSLVFSLVMLALLVAAPVSACTSFLLPWGKQVVLGKSYDWNSGHGLLLINKRSVAKQALLLPGTPGSPARWISRFGSVTFNQYGRDLPLGGMNEQGLVVEVMWLGKTDHGGAQKKVPALNELQWIQYVLDTAKTVPEVDGISMLPTLLGREQKGHEFLYWEFFERGFQQAVRHGDYKAIRLKKGRPLALYDVTKDPRESANLASERPEVVQRIEKYLRSARTPSPFWP